MCQRGPARGATKSTEGPQRTELHPSLEFPESVVVNSIRIFLNLMLGGCAAPVGIAPFCQAETGSGTRQLPLWFLRCAARDIRIGSNPDGQLANASRRFRIVVAQRALDAHHFTNAGRMPLEGVGQRVGQHSRQGDLIPARGGSDLLTVAVRRDEDAPLERGKLNGGWPVR